MQSQIASLPTELPFENRFHRFNGVGPLTGVDGLGDQASEITVSASELPPKRLAP